MATKKRKKKKKAPVLTERQAWKVVGVVFGSRSGMCRTLAELLYTCEVIDHETHDRMAVKIQRAMEKQKALDGIDRGFLYPRVECVWDDKRTAFAEKRARGAR